MIIGVTGAAKGRGVTSIACALAAALGEVHSESLLIEADSAGGDLANIRGLDALAHGVITFAAQSNSATDTHSSYRREATADTGTVDTSTVDTGTFNSDTASANTTTTTRDRDITLEDEIFDPFEGHIWRHPGENTALLPTCAGQISLPTQIDALWHDRRLEIQKWPAHVVIDLGRWGTEQTRAIWKDCDIGIAVCNGALSDLKRCQELWDIAPLTNSFATWRIVNGSPWSQNEIETATGLNFDLVLDWDSKAAESYKLGQFKKVQRRHLSRQILALAKTLCEHDSKNAQILLPT